MLIKNSLSPNQFGIHWILSEQELAPAGLCFGVCRLAPEKSLRLRIGHETALVAFRGKGEFRAGETSLSFERHDWVLSNPSVLHLPSTLAPEIYNRGREPLEVLVVRTPNEDWFAPRVFLPEQIQIEHRGKGILQDTSYRIVRLVFDDRNGPPESRLVLGEVVNLPGRWSSYPPHFHRQPEIYYYRFRPRQGYGHAELGPEVFKVEDGDLLVINGERTHAQVSAPGYHMYYLWAIRHLEEDRYDGFTFDPLHEWTLRE